MQHYLGTVDEKNVQDNFVVLYELLDEMMDNGQPQICDVNDLHHRITQESCYKKDTIVTSSMGFRNMISMHNQRIVYRRNELFVDVIERLHLKTDPSGSKVAQFEIHGLVKCKPFLSGMPDVKMALSDAFWDRVEENLCLHQNIRLHRFALDRLITLVPPDEAFDLLSYRLSDLPLQMMRGKVPLWISATVSHVSKHCIEYVCTIEVPLNTSFISSSTTSSAPILVSDICILLPVPTDIASPAWKAPLGRVDYQPEINSFAWKIPVLKCMSKSASWSGDGITQTHRMIARCDISAACILSAESIKVVPQILKDTARRPVKASFSIRSLLMSNFNLRYVKVIEKADYKTQTWVRHLTVVEEYFTGLQIVRRNDPPRSSETSELSTQS